jgi:DNA polymerase-1
MKEKWEETGVDRINASFSVHGTSSGRLSSSAPNLQNLPASVRFMYVPTYVDSAIFDVDWSSIENRLVAWFASDYERLERMNQPGFSEHKWVTSQFFDLPVEEISKDNSKDAPYGKGKRINHGMGYLMGPRKICALYDLDFKEISALCNKWKQLFPKTVEWQTEVVARAKKDGFLVTPFGRKRFFYTSDYATQAASFLPQSTAADLMFRAMIGLCSDRIGWKEEKVAKIIPFYKPLPREAKLLVTVHDSLVGESSLSVLEEVKDTMLKVMSQPFPELGGFSIPAEWKSGVSWGECK